VGDDCMKIMKRSIFCLFFILLFGTLPVYAKTPYVSYTYSSSGEYQDSPNAYIPDSSIYSINGIGTFKGPKDITTDKDQNVYVCDSGNNRLIILDSNFCLKIAIDHFVDSDGKTDFFNNPSGICIGKDGTLYIADTDNARIVVFTKDFVFLKVILSPKSNIIPEDFIYKPIAIGIDNLNRLYVISSGYNMGIITMDMEGNFQGFIGSQVMAPNPIEYLWRMFMSKEQIKRTAKIVPIDYNNIAIDAKGFIYATASSISAENLKQLVKSGNSSYAPIKKLTPSGIDVLKRNGSFAPIGDINFDTTIQENSKGPSSITEIAIKDNGVYSVVDSKYNKIFTYDNDGNMLYAFGGTGFVDGIFQTLASIAYKGDQLLAIDSDKGCITIFNQTEYGELIEQAINLQQNRQFSETTAVWENIKQYNNNYDLAFLGIGKSLYEQGNYTQAMEYFKSINNKQYYSKALKQNRDLMIKKAALAVPFLLFGLILLIVKLFGYAKSYNLQHAGTTTNRSLKEQLIYSFHVIFHPFDGFWDLKHEKRGSIKSATIILAAAAMVFIAKDFIAGYLFISSNSSLLSSVLNFSIPFVLWCIANWCLTTLMDGKGTLADIYISISYALVPIILLVLPIVLLSNVFTLEEAQLLNTTINIALLWSGFLIFFGSLVVHDYTFGKNICVCVLSIVGIAIILFLILLFLNVSSRLLAFIQNLITEISFRF